MGGGRQGAGHLAVRRIVVGVVWSVAVTSTTINRTLVSQYKYSASFLAVPQQFHNNMYIFIKPNFVSMSNIVKQVEINV